ncbi:glycosyltransferase family 2 protein [Candidatus Pacearchaeota archaeon]|nr:glycosyltransferase family 2 protein [Candidatus Pacearchaeota archaeon]
MKKPYLSIVLPCYNEAKNISIVLEKFSNAFVKFNNPNIELILVDNNSKDETKEVLKSLLKKKKYSFAKSVFQPEPGYGAALWKGLASAKGEFVGWTHADMQTPPEDVFRALEIIKSSKNKKIFLKGKRYGRPLADKLVNTLGMSIFETVVLGSFMYDINAQPNIFPKSLMKHLSNPPKDFAFDLFVYYTAKKYGYEVKRFPVYFGKRIFGESAWNTGWKARIKFIKRTMKFTFELKKKLN